VASRESPALNTRRRRAAAVWKHAQITISYARAEPITYKLDQNLIFIKFTPFLGILAAPATSCCSPTHPWKNATEQETSSSSRLIRAGAMQVHLFFCFYCGNLQSLPSFEHSHLSLSVVCEAHFVDLVGYAGWLDLGGTPRTIGNFVGLLRISETGQSPDLRCTDELDQDANA
jgi:hypothetical protein